jgi:hypothetical protein
MGRREKREIRRENSISHFSFCFLSVFSAIRVDKDAPDTMGNTKLVE